MVYFCICDHLWTGRNHRDQIEARVQDQRLPWINFSKKTATFFWLIVLIVFIGLSEAISILLGKPTTPEFMVKAYSSLASPWILWVALLVAAPLFEELFFRGFLITGLSASALRWYGAVIISSAMWAVIDVQYDLYGMVPYLF